VIVQTITEHQSNMTRNLYVVVATVIGTLLLCTAALDWNAYTEFMASLMWR
jgi:hypothetical protein